MKSPQQFWANCVPLSIKDHIAAIEARDAAIRADQARLDASFCRTLKTKQANWLAAEIERRAGIGKEKNDG